MENQFKNIDPQFIEPLEIRAAVQTLWSASDLFSIASTIRWLLRQDNLLGRCAVCDLYSYSCTTYGAWLSEAFSGLQPVLTTMARDILHYVWSDENQVLRPALQDCMKASGMHVIWRAVEMEDAPLVLRCLRSERYWRVLWPSVSAANLMRGNNETFDREVTPLLAEIAERQELSPLVRRLAIQAMGIAPSSEDLRLLEELLHHLTVPEAAACALVLLDADSTSIQTIRDAAARWPPCDEYPVAVVLERIRE